MTGKMCISVVLHNRTSLSFQLIEKEISFCVVRDMLFEFNEPKAYLEFPKCDEGWMLVPLVEPCLVSDSK